MEDLNSIYTDIVMEHSTATYNKHKIECATDYEHGHNPSCGDDITLEVIMDGDIIKDLAFTRTWVRYISSFNFYNDRSI